MKQNQKTSPHPQHVRNDDYLITQLRRDTSSQFFNDADRRHLISQIKKAVGKAVKR